MGLSVSSETRFCHECATPYSVGFNKFPFHCCTVRLVINDCRFAAALVGECDSNVNEDNDVFCWLIDYSNILQACYRPNSTWLDSTRLDSSRLDTTRHVRRVEPMHFGCVELVEEHSSTRSTRRARLARHHELDWLDWLDTSSSTGATCNLVMITVIHLLFNLSYSMINWSKHLFNLFHLAEQIGFMRVRKNNNTCKKRLKAIFRIL